ncbi:MAG: DUF1080 domain-containing protein [Candidatus Hydrogenedentes bacterium]|nr:DUF1080 domain-containing protein [Candidatus Hydrogenedentota bacterium]
MLKHVRLAIAVLMIGMTPAFANQGIQGNWEGAFSGGDWNKFVLRAEVIGQPGNTYRALIYIGDLQAVELAGLSRGDAAVFAGEVDLGMLGKFAAWAQARNGEMQGELLPGSGAAARFAMKRVVKTPPTLGQAPPEGAVVLLGEGTGEDAWKAEPGNFANGEMRIGGNTYTSKHEYGDAQVHVEFLCPYMPDQSGQARGNSGVYVHGRYEVQVLDSFADAPGAGTCGAIYSIAVPPAGACLPPGEWQTYDITFRAPKFDAAGKKTADAVITVVQNGQTLYNNMTLPHPTPGGIDGKEAALGPLMLQNHGNEVRFRNVWVLPLDK